MGSTDNLIKKTSLNSSEYIKKKQQKTIAAKWECQFPPSI